MSRAAGGRGASAPTLDIHYKPPGPVAAQFIRAAARVKVIIGPVGSGKTRAMLFDGLSRACRQPPSPIDGLRRYRTATVRATYRQLWKLTIESWHKLVPPDYGAWSGGQDQPARHVLTFPHPSGDGSRVEYVRDFLALGEQTLEEACRGYEPTDWELDELDTLPDTVLSYCLSRAGRYPDPIHGLPWWRGVRACANAFDVDSPFYHTLIEACPEGWAVFRQPGGLDPGAENTANLPVGYYQDMIVGAAEDFVRRYVHNEFGFSRDGKPVYPEFRDSLHVAAEPLRPVAGLPLVIGADAGLTPAAVFCQRTASGTWLVLDELVFEGGGQAFGEAIHRQLAEPGYRALVAERAREGVAEAIRAWCDPTAESRSQTDERSWAEVVSAVTGLRFRGAPSNAPALRIEAVRQPLTRLIDGRPGLILSPTCRMLRRGFNSSYRFKRLWVGGRQVRTLDRPEKNEASHVHDALQYALLGGGEYLSVRGRRPARAPLSTTPRFALTERPTADRPGGPRFVAP